MAHATKAVGVTRAAVLRERVVLRACTKADAPYAPPERQSHTMANAIGRYVCYI